MHATARSHIARPVPLAPARPQLRAVAPRPRRRRLPRAATVALYAFGLVVGFLLAALASAPGGAGVVTGELRLAGVAALVGAVALLRARAVARRRPRIRRIPL
ncbi:MAG: hypothetical protein AB7O78_00870 [Thermoleophilia bacterium]